MSTDSLLCNICVHYHYEGDCSLECLLRLFAPPIKTSSKESDICALCVHWTINHDRENGCRHRVYDRAWPRWNANIIKCPCSRSY